MSFLGADTRKTLLFGIIIPALSYILLNYTLFDRRPVSRLAELGLDPSALDIDTVSPQLAQRLGLRSKRPATELVVVVISASFCAANRIEGFHKAVKAIPDLLAAQIANRPDMVTRLVGVSVDPDARMGTDYLNDLAAFDEVVAGSSWLNTATEKYLWGKYAVAPGIPQVLLLSRTVTWSRKSPLTMDDEKLLETFSGADAIIDWVNEDARVRDLNAPGAGSTQDSGVVTGYKERMAVP